MRLVLLLAMGLTACQRPAEKLDVDVLNLQPAPVEATPVRAMERGTYEPPVPPPLVARGTATPSGEPLTVAVHVDVDGATGGELAVEFTSPDGLVYERQAKALGDAPLTTQAFDFVLPVAGTWIETQQLFGEWRAHVFVGPDELFSESFTLSP